MDFNEEQHPEIRFVSEPTVELLRCMASDDFVIETAKVSTKGRNDVGDMDESGKYGFIDFLVKNRHGSPLEHSVFTFFVSCPIFVARELMRHRIASFNELSGRYSKFEPVFYIPSESRKLIQKGKPGRYNFVSGPEGMHEEVDDIIRGSITYAWASYNDMLNEGVAREVARMVLPVNTMTSLYMTVNARSLMNVLSLRTIRGGTKFPSYPQYEIQQVAEKMEEEFARVMPLTYRSFNENGRVSP